MLNVESIGMSMELHKHLLGYQFRYEKYWIPFIAANSPEPRFDTNFSPPFDVLWVWHVHMLAPQHYATDLQNSILGRVYIFISILATNLMSREND